MKFLLTFLVVILCTGSQVAAQHKSVDINQIDSLMAITKKPIVLLLSTDWCSYCAMQKNALHKNKEFQKRSASQFYYAEFNAESKDNVVFAGKKYVFQPSGISSGMHKLATALSEPDNVTFPAWILLDSTYRVVYRHSGFLSKAQLKELYKVLPDLNIKIAN